MFNIFQNAEKSCSKIVSLKLYENDGFTKLSNFGEIDVEIKKLEIFDVYDPSAPGTHTYAHTRTHTLKHTNTEGSRLH